MSGEMLLVPADTGPARLADDPDANMFIGDASWITFVIPEAALRERRFEAARARVFIG